MTKRSDNLSSIDSLSASDVFILGVQSFGGDLGKMAPSVLLTYLNSNLTFPSEAYVTQYSAPSATGFSVTITDGDDNDENVHLILTPAAGYATGTIVLPASTSLVDKQEVLVNCTQAVTTLTIDKNGATALTGAPSALTANQFFRLKYDKPTSTWYRVG